MASATISDEPHTWKSHSAAWPPNSASAAVTRPRKAPSTSSRVMHRVTGGHRVVEGPGEVLGAGAAPEEQAVGFARILGENGQEGRQARPRGDEDAAA